jgi:RsiW-degrading membrane proteinase PrsW (M82 family)
LQLLSCLIIIELVEHEAENKWLIVGIALLGGFFGVSFLEPEGWEV